MIRLPEDHPLVDRKYTIITRQTMDFMGMISFMIDNSLPGMIGYGPGRIGKTTSIDTVMRVIQNECSGQIVIMKTIIETHKSGEVRKFYEEICDNLDLEWNDYRPTSSSLRSLIINHMIEKARENNNKVLLIVDEASKMFPEDFDYMMDIYNRLEAKGVRLICVFVGTEHLDEIRKELHRRKESQIIGRFMVHSFEFKPVIGLDKIREVLTEFDESVFYQGRVITEDMFPASYMRGKRLAEEAENVWDAVLGIRRDVTSGKRKRRSVISEDESIQMQYLILAIEMIMTRQGKYSGKEKWPSKDDWFDALRKVGFPQAIEME